MPSLAQVIEPLSAHHDRSAFDCGNESLTRYLRTQAGQDLRKRAAVPYVLLDAGTGVLVGYYTLSACRVDAAELPADIAKRLPRYRHLPATLLGRLAVDLRFQGTGIGKLLLADAMSRTLTHSKQIASVALIVDAIDEAASAFYQRHGFIPFPDQPATLFLPMETIAKSFVS
ncbi:MAG: GNAT family N-acetyltransferase [Dehalococcoidia bacterium]